MFLCRSFGLEPRHRTHFPEETAGRVSGNRLHVKVRSWNVRTGSSSHEDVDAKRDSWLEPRQKSDFSGKPRHKPDFPEETAGQLFGNRIYVEVRNRNIYTDSSSHENLDTNRDSSLERRQRLELSDETAISCDVNQSGVEVFA